MNLKFKTILFSSAAPTFVFGGACLMVLAPFLPLIFLDTQAPSWLSPYSLFGLGFTIAGLGIWFWIIAWNLWFPSNKKMPIEKN